MRTISQITSAISVIGIIVAPNISRAQTGQPARVRSAIAAPRPTMPMMASVDTMLFSRMKYRQVGHTIGGRVTAVTGVPSLPRTFYMGAASGGVFRTTDAGQTWVPITDGENAARLHWCDYRFE